MEQFNVLSLQTNAFHYDGDREKTRPMNSNEKSENKINDLFDDIAYNKGRVIHRKVYFISIDYYMKLTYYSCCCHPHVLSCPWRG